MDSQRMASELFCSVSELFSLSLSLSPPLDSLTRIRFSLPFACFPETQATQPGKLMFPFHFPVRMHTVNQLRPNCVSLKVCATVLATSTSAVKTECSDFGYRLDQLQDELSHLWASQRARIEA